MHDIERLITSRTDLGHSPGFKAEKEGGCGVIGIAASEKIAGKHLLPALSQMCNRGNGKGGGIAASGMSPQAFGISQEELDSHYLLAIAYLDLKCRTEVERDCIEPLFEVAHVHEVAHIPDYRVLRDLDVAPPEVVIYFVRVKKELVKSFQKEHELTLPSGAVEDEMVYQNTQQLNHRFYSALHEKRAFVLSHGKDLLVLKMVGFGDDVILYYQLEDFEAHVWIGHHRYPTKGRVWHPGGAHPFIGLNEALVHNGDFANYFSMCEYLSERHIKPFFLTDTEVAALLFDLLYRTYGYPLEYVIEALAPTTERDFALLSKMRQEIYQLLQVTHMHGSPDGPWFFLIAQSEHRYLPSYRLIGITDTSMLRPQVFALQRGKMSIGLSASEKQAIDAVLDSLAQEGKCWGRADAYWSARGGSHTDGGAFLFEVKRARDGHATLVCRDKFNQEIHTHALNPFNIKPLSKTAKGHNLPENDRWAWLKKELIECDYDQLESYLIHIAEDSNYKRAFNILTQLFDQHYAMKHMRRSCVLALVDQSLDRLVEAVKRHPTSEYAYLGYQRSEPELNTSAQTLVIDARGFPSEGKPSLARAIVHMYQKGFKKFIVVHCEGQRFIANGLGPNTEGVEIDVFGSSGDYLGSGIDGACVRVHGGGQDQLGQILKQGTLVVYGDVGQTFMYGAKGGEVYVKGNAAGRPLINAVGSPRVVINGTCLDYLAESFMAGAPLKGGGFAIINGLGFDEQGKLMELASPYPGSNLFSLASGGAIYIRDPGHRITSDQLNGGEISHLFHSDWELILPYLERNAAFFHIPLARLLEYEGKSLHYHEAYRKISPAPTRVLQEEEAWVKGKA